MSTYPLPVETEIGESVPIGLRQVADGRVQRQQHVLALRRSHELQQRRSRNQGVLKFSKSRL